MLLLTALALAFAGPASNGDVTLHGTTFGPRVALTCTWFSNFENSRFDQCAGAGGNLLADGGASLDCAEGACEHLDAEARTVSNWQKPEPPWGRFSVRILGRLSKDHRPQYLGDGAIVVRVEKVLSVRELK